MNTSSTALSVFTFAPGLNLRTVLKDGEPWFVAMDVCKALGFHVKTDGSVNTTHALRHCRADEIITRRLSDEGRSGPAKLVSESGLYKLIMRSNKPEARGFQEWVTKVVLPAIRKNGMYMTPKVASEAVETPALFMARALLMAEETIQKQGKRLVGMDPAAEHTA